MQIAIDISPIVYGTGVSVYTKNLVKNLLKVDKENNYLLLGMSLRRKKEIRDFLGLAGEFWLKMYTVNGKIVAEPVDKKIDRQQYLKDLLSIKGGWLDEKEIIRNRKQIEERLKKNSL